MHGTHSLLPLVVQLLVSYGGGRKGMRHLQGPKQILSNSLSFTHFHMRADAC